MARRHINLKTKLAAALLQVRDAKGDPLIDWEHAKQMTAHQIVSLWVWDHYPLRFEAGGPDEPWNLQPRLITEHRERTAKVDIPQIAKTKRISKDHEEFRRRLLTPRDEREPKQSRWGKRPFQKRRK